jgi:MFS family permease
MTTNTQPARAQGTGSQHHRAVLVIVLVGCFMIVLDNSIIFTGLPEIQKSMNLDPAALSRVQNAYTLVVCFAPLIAGTATLAGRVVDAYTGGAVMIAIALIIPLIFILPADLVARRRAEH